MSKLIDILERLGALQRSEMRRFVQSHSLQMVHLEVLSYLLKCNRYSDTTLALSEYLGQTKGSISQTINFLEKEGYLKRSQDSKDRRIFHLNLLSKGIKLVEKFDSGLFKNIKLQLATTLSLEHALRELQKSHSFKSFGICSTCRFNENPSGRTFKCGLTGENLTTNEIKLICQEHEHASRVSG